MVLDEISRTMPSGANFFQKKGLDDLAVTEIYNAETDWIEIRFAEVLMNYGECANELDKKLKHYKFCMIFVNVPEFSLQTEGMA